jgi:hypothetical protein
MQLLHIMDSYLIRIYRRSTDDPQKVVGMVEEIDSGRTHAFHDLLGLCRTLSHKNKPEEEPVFRKALRENDDPV